MMKAFIGAVCMYGIKSCRFDNDIVTYILPFLGIDPVGIQVDVLFGFIIKNSNYLYIITQHFNLSFYDCVVVGCFTIPYFCFFLIIFCV